MRLLYAGDLEVLQNHLRKGLFGSVFSAVLFEIIDQLVVEIFKLGFGSDGFECNMRNAFVNEALANVVPN